MKITLTNNVARTSAALLCAVSVYTLASSDAYAQVPSRVAPELIQKRFDKPTNTAPSRDVGLPAAADVEQLSPKARAQLEKKQIILKKITFQGNTVFSNDDLAFAYEGMIGKKISLADLKDIAKKVTDHYKEEGYTLSQAIVPQQDISSGNVKIRIVEGYVSGIVIEGDVSESEKDTIRSIANHIVESKPVRIQDLERYMLILNDLPGSTVSGLLKPSAHLSGAADLVLNVSIKTFDGSYTLDNRGSKYIGPFQHSLTLGANSIFGIYDRTQFRFSTVNPVEELQSYEFQHEEQISSYGTKALLTLSQTNTAPGDSLESLNIVGNSTLYALKFTHPIIRERQQTLIGRFSFDARDTQTNIFETVNVSKDRLRTIRAGATYNVMDDFKGNNLFDLQLSQGLDIFDATSSGTNRSNANGNSEFTKINADISRVQALPYKFSVLTSATGQYSDAPLLVSEQFSLGGQEYGQAFDPSELLGDQAVAGKIELRYDQSVGQPYLASVQPYTYYDIGKIWQLSAAAGSNENTVLSSFGFGVRTAFTENFSGTAEASFPLEKPTVDQTSYRNEPRVFFSATARF